MHRALLSSVFVGLLAVGCSAGSRDDAIASDDGAFTEAPANDSVASLDALVQDINGYASADAWVNHPRSFSDDLDDRFLKDASCMKFAANESRIRSVTRDHAQHVRKLGLTYSSHEGDVMVTSHQSYHYDANGKLRVVVIDREEDHTLDEPFVREADAHNVQLKAQQAKMPLTTEMDKVAVANLLLDLRTVQRVIQYRLYFRADGSLFAETKSDDLDHARALDFEAISQMPPTLYSDLHPANVEGTPYLTNLFPNPLYAMRPIARTNVPATESMQKTLIAANPSDPEASLAATPICR